MIAAIALAFLGAIPIASASGHNDGGANQSGPFDPNGVGEGDNQGNGNAPANGTVGNADGKNPPGQVKNGGDRGYECDDNSGVGNNGGNPAHSGCASSPGTSPPVLPTESTAPTDTLPTESSVPGTKGNPGGAPAVLGIEQNAPAAVPTAVAGGADNESSTSGAPWILLGGALALAGLALGLVPATSRGKREL